ncbi:pyridoxal-phosphate dependent enzyme, partial [Helicosporidium sp. ATCC 50920]
MGGSGPPPEPPLADPEDFVAPAGQLLPINRTTPPSPADVYRCAGCERPACAGPSGCAEFQWRNVPGGYLREILASKVYRVAKETPTQLAKGLSASLNVRFYLKREDLQDVHSFKIRGAFNRMAVLSREELDRGVICSSAGNHAQGVALSASVLGCDAVICMPVNSPEIKIAAVQALGGTVELVGETFYEAAAHAVARSKREGRTLINAYDDPLCIAGQGTAGHEILRQVEDADYVFVAVGGGGLIAGVASILKAVKPDIKVIGVEPAGANAMTQSLVRGCRVTLSKVDAFADGVAIKLPGAEAFRICRELLDGMVLVDNSAISSAIKEVFNETRSILEPAGAVSVAGAAAFARYYGLQNVSVVAVTSGANMNFDRLRLVSEMANVGVAETMF